MSNPKGFSQAKLQDLQAVLEDHVWNNRAEIMTSKVCMCTACYQRFLPSAITKWQEGNTAVCPNPACGFGGAVLGSASGLNFDDYDYSAFE